MPEPLAPRQKDVLLFISDYQQRYECAPTVRELCEGLGVTSTNTIDYHLKALERKGYIRRRGNLARSIEVVDRLGGPQRSRGLVRLPVVGEIAAGLPIQALAQFIGYRLVRPECLRDGAGQRAAGVVHGRRRCSVGRLALRVLRVHAAHEDAPDCADLPVRAVVDRHPLAYRPEDAALRFEDFAGHGSFLSLCGTLGHVEGLLANRVPAPAKRGRSPPPARAGR